MSEPHPFTIASGPSKTNLEFFIRHLGDWSDKLPNQDLVGTKVFIEGPYGTFEPLGETLGIPDEVHIGCMIPLGWPDANFGPLKRVPYEKVVHRNGWQGELRTYPPT